MDIKNMINSKFKITNKVDNTITKEVSYTASDTTAGDGSAMQTFADVEGNNFVFLHPEISNTDITTLQNDEWTIEQLPFVQPEIIVETTAAETEVVNENN